MGAFDDLVPPKSSGTFDEFVPKTKPSDVGKALVSGAVKGVGTTLAGGGNIVAQGVNRLSEALTGVNPLLRSEDPLKPVSTAIDESKSEGGKRAKELSTPKGDILKPETWSLGEDPSIGGYLQNIADVGGQFATPAAVAGATAKASKLVQHIAGAATGGLQASGAGAEEEGKRVRSMPEDQLKTAYTAYNDYLKRGMDPSEARERTALDAEAGGAVGAGVPGTAEGVIVQALLRRGIRLPTFGASRPAQIASAGLAGGAGEAVQEVAEGVGQRAGSNIAAGGNQNVTDDSFGNAVLGFAGGKMAGAGIEALAGAKPAETGPQPTPGPLPTPPEGGGSTPGPQGEAEPATAGAPAAPVGDSFDRKDVIGIASRVVSELTSKEQGFEFKGADGVVQKQDPQPLTREEIEERDFLRANVENPDAIAERYGFALRNDTPPFTEEMLGKALGTLDAQNNLTRILRDFRPVPRPDGTPANMDMRELINQARGEAGQSPLSEADWQRIQGFDAPEPMVSKDKPGATASAKKSFPFNTESAALQFAKNRYGEGNFTIAPHPKVPGRFAVTEGRNEASGTPATATPVPATAKKGGARQANAPAERVGAQVADTGGAARAATGAEGVTAAANEAATSPTNDLPEPTEAQAAAGNYKKGHTRVAGLDISIENPTGSTRRGTDRDGTPWEVTMSSHYGYIKRTEGKDGEQVDVYVKPETPPDYNGPVFVVNQVEPGSGKFDEHKVIIGARSQKEAEQIYDAHFQDGSGPQRRRTVGMVTMNGFKQWLKEGDTTKPFTRSPKLSAPSAAREQASEIKSDTKPEPPKKADSTPSVERRKDSETRKRVDDMSPDELRAALLTDRMTGLHNGRWMEDNLSRFSHFVAFDADGLKWINDNMGHSSGDELLKAYGRALQQVSENSVKLRDGGDEYFILANSQQEAENLSKQVEDILAEASISQEVDGEIITVKGIGVSYGIGQSVEEADTGLNESKRERTATGKRAARNEAPPTVIRTAAAGRENRVDQAAGRVDESAQASTPAEERRDVRGDNPPERADSEAGGGGVPAPDEMADASRPAREAPDSPQQSEVAQKTPAAAGVSASEGPTPAEKAEKIEAQRAARTGKGKTSSLFSRGTAVAALEPSEVHAILRTLGVEGNVVAAEADLPMNLRMSIKSQGAEGQTNGLYDPLTGEIWVNASRMSSMTMTAAVALHESAHRGLRVLFGDDLTPVLNGIYATNQSVKKRAGELMDKYGYDQVRATEEVLADMALAGHAKQLKGWQRLVAFIREWLANRGLKINFSDEAVELIVAGAVEVGKRKAVSVLDHFDISSNLGDTARAGDPQLSRSQRKSMQTESKAFKDWFGDSKVVDANGKPLVVYHGTSGPEFGEFRMPAFFTNDAQAAEWYHHTDENPRNIPVYLSIQRPFSVESKEGAHAFVRLVQAAGVAITLEEFPDGSWSFETDEISDHSGYDGSNLNNLVYSPRVREALTSAGYDGVIANDGMENYEIKAYIPLQPGQIKSATANSGAFDSTNSDIYFSRGDDWKSALTQKRIAEEIGNYLHTTRSFNAFHKTVGTQMHKAKVDTLPGRKPGDTGTFGKVYNIGQSYLRDVSRFANESADLAPDVLPQIRDVKGALTFAKTATKADIEAVSKVVFEGTLDKMLYSPAELKRIGLTDKQAEMYGQTRDAINHSLDMLVSAEAARLAKDEVSPSVILEAKEKPYTGAMLIRQALVDKAAEKQADLPAYAERLRGLADEIFAKMERVSELKAEAYAPLMRFGEHTVYVTEQNADGNVEQVYFGMYESAAKANRAAKALAEEFPGATITRGVMSQDAYKMFQGITPDTLELFSDLVSIEVDGETVPLSQTDIYQQYLKLAVNNRSALKRMITRKNVAGYSEDVSRVLAAFLTSNARAAAGNYHLGEMLEAVNQIPKEKGDVKDEAIALMKYLQNPQEEWAGLRGFMFIQYLGGSIASAMVNTTQPLTMTLPYLSQFGFKEAVIALKNGVAMATGAKKIPPGPLQEAIERAEVEGVVNPQEIHQLQAEASRNFGSNIMVRKGLTLWGSLFALAEQFNRRSTFIAAYEMAKAKNMVDPYRFAVNAVEETQGVYNRGNRPNWARGAVGATLFTFKQFSISYLEFLKRLPNREKALALAILMVAAGMQGLPFADDLDDIIDTIAQSLGYSFNVEEEKKKFLTRVLGEGLASFVMHGASTLPGVPLDIQGRLGLGNLIPGTGILKRSETDKTRDIVEVLGPAGGLAKSIAGAASELQGGDIKGAAMQALPVAIQNALKGYDMAQLGMYRDMKGRKVMDTDAYDAFIKTVGFQPAKVAQESRRIQLATQDIALVKRVEGEIVEAWAQGLFEKDLKKSADAARKLMEWNKRNPEAFIRIQPSQIQRRIKEMTLTRQQRFVKAAPQEMRAAAQDLTIAPAR